jgi:glycine betaine/proline transport system ATP-binding protein
MGRAQKTTIFVTHDLNEALKLGDRIAIMRDGEFIQVGSPEELVSNPANEFVEDFIRDIPRGKVILVRNIMVEPKLVLYDWQGPQVALFAMRARNAEHAFVVDIKRKFKSVVTLAELKEATNNNIKRLETVIREGSPRIESDRPIEEAARLAAASEKPLAAVDAAGNLLGEVPRVALLSAMAGEEEVEKDTDGQDDKKEAAAVQERVPDEKRFEPTNN